MSQEPSQAATGVTVQGLYGVQEAVTKPSAEAEATGGRPRLRCADRQQVEMHYASLDELLPEDHRARIVWDYVASLPLEGLYRRIQAVEGHAGRSATDPKILLALWLYATVEGVGSARELDEFCQFHQAYAWICGGVGVNYHTLADFRTEHVVFLDQLLSDSVATLMHQGLVSLEQVAEDGMRVRASAGSDTFRHRATLEQCQAQAQEQVRRLREEVQADPAAARGRRQAARERAARERAQRLGQALAEIAQLEQQRPGPAKEEPASAPDDPDGQAGGKKSPAAPRVSPTDPQARVMKMGDGGYRPAFNVQYATDTASQIITGVRVTNRGSDRGEAGLMVQQLQERYGQSPAQMLVDGGFIKQTDLDQVAQEGVTVYAPVAKPRQTGVNRYQPREGDSVATAAWRVRMGTAEAREIYKKRGSTAECINALTRNRGLRQFLVRGLEKVRAVALLFALAHNLLRAATLRAQVAAVAA